MELLDGQTLAQRIAGKPLGIDVLLDLAIQISDALHTAHSKGAIHRDVKPPDWSQDDGKLDRLANLAGYGRLAMGRFGWWTGLGPDGSLLAARDISNPGDLRARLGNAVGESRGACPAPAEVRCFCRYVLVRNSFADHVEDDLLEAYSLEKLRGADLAYVEEHLFICQDCRGRLETFDAFVQSMRAAAKQFSAGRRA